MSIVEECTVTQLDGKYAIVSLLKQEKCEGCKICSFGKKNMISLSAINNIECKVNDNVLVEMPEKSITLSPVILYIIPLVLLTLGIVLGSFVSEIFAILLGVALVIIGIVIVALIDRLYRKNPIYMPKIIKKVLDKEQEGEEI